MLKFTKWWFFAVFAISTLVCGTKWHIFKRIVKTTKTDLQNIKLGLFKNVFIFSNNAILIFEKKLGRLILHLNATRPLRAKTVPLCLIGHTWQYSGPFTKRWLRTKIQHVPKRENAFFNPIVHTKQSYGFISQEVPKRRSVSPSVYYKSCLSDIS